MKKSIVTLLAGISCAALIFGGCASDAVKPDPPVVPSATQTNIQPAQANDPAAEAAKRAAADAEAAAKQKAAADAAAQQAALEAAQKAAQKAAADAAAAAEAAQKAAAAQAAANTFEAVYFDFDKADLRQDTRDVLSKNAEIILKSMPNAKVQIEGHCDERGSAEYNLALGERRAKSAQKYLTTLGVKAGNLTTISYGKEKPAVVGSDEAAWAKNRRAEFTVVK